ncbi:hypothetical protein RFI_15452, partial [Reticulomyxa filosa]
MVLLEACNGNMENAVEALLTMSTQESGGNPKPSERGIGNALASKGESGGQVSTSNGVAKPQEIKQQQSNVLSPDGQRQSPDVNPAIKQQINIPSKAQQDQWLKQQQQVISVPDDFLRPPSYFHKMNADNPSEQNKPIEVQSQKVNDQSESNNSVPRSELTKNTANTNDLASKQDSETQSSQHNDNNNTFQISNLFKRKNSQTISSNYQ